MFAKLAIRNVRRQIGNYLIYFITVSLTVALMFAVNNALFNQQVLAIANAMSEFQAGLIAITVLVSLIVAFVLGYATSFMLKLRKREFGTYLILGMTRRNILRIFILETCFLMFAALGTGIVLGLGVSQGLTAIIANLMETEFSFGSYSLKGCLLTVGLVTGLFLLSSGTSALYLSRVRIYNLLHVHKKSDKQIKYPLLWLILAAISLAGIVCACILFAHTIGDMSDNAGFILFITLVLLAVSIVLFHVSIAKSVVNLLLKSNRIKNHGTNAFTLRRLSAQMNANALLAGALSFLLSFAVIGANVSFTQQQSNRERLDREYPFDIRAEYAADTTHPISFDEAETLINTYVSVKNRLDYNIYTNGSSYLHGFTPWSGEGYELLKDSFISQSDFNRLYGSIGIGSVDTKNGFFIAYDRDRVENCDFSSAVLRSGEETFPFCGYIPNCPNIGQRFFLAIVPDRFVAGLPVLDYGIAFRLDDKRYNANALRTDLSYTVQAGQYTIERCDFNIREYHRLQFNASNAVFVVSALYIATVFVFLAMAILALKTLSGISDDKKHYDVLFRLGANKQEQNNTLFKQIFFFFFLPFALPILLSIPTGIICRKILAFSGFAQTALRIPIVTTVIALIITAVYALYFTATYLIAKRNVIKP